MLGTVCHITEQSNPSKNLYPIGRTTRASMAKLTPKKQLEHLTKQVKRNIVILSSQLKYIDSLPSDAHCFRISSDLLPLFDCPVYGHHYTELMPLITAQLNKIGDKHKHIRLGMHPDQFCVLNSNNADTRAASVRVIEYHAKVGQLLNRPSQAWNINVHLNAKGTDFSAFDQLTGYARAALSIENGDNPNRDMDAYQVIETCQKYGLRALFDVHHHLCCTGEIAACDSDLVRGYISTWQGVKPLMHVSQGREGKTDNKHGDLIASPELVDWVKGASKIADIEVEAKHKTVAVMDLFRKIS